MIPTIKLCHGAGNGKNSACLATAVSMITGQGEKTDSPDCLCFVMRAFIIPTNDMLSDDLRREFYGDLPWQIIGTATRDRDTLVARARVAADAAKRFVPLASITDSTERRRAVAKLCRETILAMAAVGDRIPAEPELTPRQLADLLT